MVLLLGGVGKQEQGMLVTKTEEFKVHILIIGQKYHFQDY